MKVLVRLLLLYVFFSVLEANSIDAQIEAIQKAPVSERFKLMNALKKRLVRMKEKERLDALSKLRSTTKNKKAHHSLSKMEKKTKHIVKQQLEHEMDNYIENEVENQIEANSADNGGGDDD